MMKRDNWVSFLLTQAIIFPPSVHGNEDDGCSLYLAESSIAKSGFGVYTTKSFSPGDVVSQDMAIPFVDTSQHLGENAGNIRWMHDDYVWRSQFAEEHLLAEEVHMNAFPIGALTNFHTVHKNVEPIHVKYDDSLLSRDDPGAGAFTYHERSFEAERDIEAGEEIFSNYGEHWLGDNGYDFVPRSEDYRKARHFVKEMSKAKKEWDDEHLETMTKIIAYYDERSASLIPSTPAGLTSATPESLTWTNVTNRTVSWIRENGQCLDHIYAGKSTLPHAGRGAFAKRKLSKGDIITPFPLLQIMNKTNMTLYGYDMEGDVKVRNEEEVVGKQLLINYCFTHPESYLLLCPSTHGALINHSQKPNAEYRWSTFHKKTEEWLKMSWKELEQRKDQGLTLEIVATRDIKPDEEIFIDYGEEWQEAWDKHIQKPRPKLTEYGSAYQMNQEEHEIRTADELIENPYPANIMTVCEYNEFEEESELTIPFLSDFYDDQFTLKSSPVYGNDITMEQFIEQDASPFDRPEPEHMEYWPCKIYQRNDDDTYTVRIFQSPYFMNTEWTAEGLYRFVKEVPKDAIQFVTKPYMSDMFSPTAFRHPIIIRDELFPSQWKNLKN